MRANVIPSAADEPDAAGAELHLVSLAPSFDEQEHGVYFRLLDRAVRHRRVTNVALTGGYGVGKSSVLDKLESDPRYERRLVRLSLSTITPDALHKGAARNDGQRESRVNQIEKEIVKQLLYTTRPEEVPKSRYRRTSVPDRKRRFGVAVGSGLAAWVITLVLAPIGPFFAAIFPGAWRQALAYLIAACLFVLAAWIVVTVIRARPAVSASVGAAATTLTLSRQADTYFDEYLDEIVYVFQVTRRDVVLIEDIDRFEDVEIFDALRALNGLLNSSAQIGRRIVFVYAIRDSVFELIGREAKHLHGINGSSRPDHASRIVKRASRTKFFDVIIPVVPFVSADNARDLMSEAMKSDEFKISPALIRLAARHVADMRLIHNIRNEFEVYRNQLVVPDTRIPGISDDLVFAIVLYKNVHLDDFELIRSRQSALDRLYRAWRTLVATELKVSAIPALRAFQSSEELTARKQDRARILARRLNELRDDLQEAAPANHVVSLQSDLPPLDEPSTWAKISADDDFELVIASRPNSSITLKFTAEMLSRILGSDVEPAEWDEIETRAIDRELADLASEVYFLRHHSWVEIYSRQDLTVDVNALTLTPEDVARLAKRDDPEREASFAELAEALLTSELACDLVKFGYLTPYFASYASVYYGKHLSPAAREYMYRCVDPGEPDAIFALRPRDVRQILREQDAQADDHADVFSDPSILNVNIVDFLLKQRPSAASTVAVMLAQDPNRREEFLDTYMAQGRRPSALLSAMLPVWRETLTYVASTESITPADRRTYLDDLLGQLADANYGVNDKLAQLLKSNYEELEAIVGPASEAQARIAMNVLAANGVHIRDLTPLNEAARSAAIALKLYPVTAVNLRALIPKGAIGLDSFAQIPPAYEHVLSHLADYLQLAEADPANFRAIIDRNRTARTLNDLQGVEYGLILRWLALLPSGVKIDSLGLVPESTWPALADSGRAMPTFDNAELYFGEFGIDEHFKLMFRGRKVTDSANGELSRRREIAYAVLGARHVIPSTLGRSQIASSLLPGQLDPDELAPESGDLPARLLKARLLEDNLDLFGSPLMLDWATLEATVKQSKRFASMVSPAILPVGWVGSFLRSKTVTKDQRLAVVRTLAAYLAVGSARDARAIADALISGRWKIAVSRIGELRAAGASASQIVQLVSLWGGEIAKDDVDEILTSLGGDYERVVVGGRGRPTFPDDAAHLAVIGNYLGSTVRATESRTFRTRGRRLVAILG